MQGTATWTWIACVLALAGCKQDSKDSKGDVAATAPAPAPVAAADGDACAAAVAHIATLAEVPIDVAVETANCRSQRWPAAFLSCATTAPDTATYADACMKAVFPPDTRLEVKRRFDGVADNSAVTPPAGSQDGDFVVYSRDEGCGILWIVRPPGEAGYVLCGDTLMAGPLTTGTEIEDAFAELARLSRAGHDLQMELMKKWPTGRTVRVYDEVGNYVGEKVE